MLLIQIASLGLVLWRAQSRLPSGYTYTRVSGQLTGGAFIASKFIRAKERFRYSIIVLVCWTLWN
jgi:hypothetical protein